ncbi:MAG: thiamine pyrophosphate-dependent enzyme [Candidatus Aenigmatarchaeota archaeon]
MSEDFYQGHSSCAGCPIAIALRSIMKVAGKDVIISNATSCSEIISTPYPVSAWPVPYIHVAFECAAAVASGIEAAQKKLGKKSKIIVLAGDGGTYDIGLQSLSGMVDRGHDVLYICYDNECYANTGCQRSSATEFAAWTTTSPIGKNSIGNKTFKKPIAEMMIAQGAVYVATTSVGYPKDIQEKITKALSIEGPKFILIHAPCPLAWKFDFSKTVEIAKLAVETGLWAMYEHCDGKREFTMKPSFKPVADYFKSQGRFKHIKQEEIKKAQEHVKKYWENIKC